MDFDKKAFLGADAHSDFDKYAFLGIEKKQPSLIEQYGPMAKKAATAVANDPLVQMGLNVASGDVGNTLLAAKQIAQNPSDTARSPTVQAGLPVAGGILGSVAGPGGTAAGAAAGELARQAVGTALAPETVPQTALGRAGSVLSSGLVQEPQVLNAIPGVPQIGKMIGTLTSKAGTNAAKFGEALTGAKAKDLEQAARQGLSTYGAPSMESAQNTFGQAMAKEGISARPPLKQIVDPALSTARKTALAVGDKLEKGLDLTAEEALRGRQAVDRIYNATPLTDRATRGNLADLRRSFDDILSNKSGALANASDLYRKAIVKSNILNPFRITKQGQMSAVAPMVATLAASAGLAGGHRGEAGLGGLGYLAASSPMVAGLAATAGGSAAQGLNAIANNPAARQVLLQLLQKLQGQQQTQAPEQP